MDPQNEPKAPPVEAQRPLGERSESSVRPLNFRADQLQRADLEHVARQTKAASADCGLCKLVGGDG